MADTPVQEPQEFSRLAHLQVTFFAVLMGFFGLSLAWHAAADSFPLAQTVARAVLWLGGSVSG